MRFLYNNSYVATSVGILNSGKCLLAALFTCGSFISISLVYLAAAIIRRKRNNTILFPGMKDLYRYKYVCIMRSISFFMLSFIGS